MQVRPLTATLLAGLLGCVTAAATPASAAGAPPTGPQLLMSRSTDRSAAGPLDGTVQPGPVSVWLAGATGTVTFSLDGRPVHVEGSGPYDLGSTLADGRSGAYAAPPGPHVLRADVVTPSGTTRVQAAFVSTTAYALMASDQPARNPATPLDGSLRAPALHAFVPDTGTIRSVAFTVDGAAAGSESTAPYDLAGTATSGGPGTRTLTAGRHVLRAVVTPRTGSPVTLTASFAIGRSVPVSTTAQLRGALAAARPGDVISLADGTYVSSPQFEAAADGTEQQPVVLTGGRGAVLSTQRTIGGGYGLHVTGDWWVVRGLAVRSSLKGVVLDGARHAVLDGIEVGQVGQEAIRFRTSSADGLVRSAWIHDTGTSTPDFGEGVYVGSAESYWPTYGDADGPDRSDRVLVLGTRFERTTAESVDTKEGTSFGAVVGNSFSGQVSGQHYADSWVDVKADDQLVAFNDGQAAGSGDLVDAFQVHPNADWGQRAVFRRNAVTGSLPGYGVRVSSGATATVACDNSMPGAKRGLANAPCG